jgi:hypothetical protein
LTKAQAARLINSAVASGWTRTVDPLKLDNGAPFCVQVNLSKTVRFANGYINDGGQIIVSFRRNSRGRIRSVSVGSRRHYSSKLAPGAWLAGYILREVNKATP